MGPSAGTYLVRSYYRPSRDEGPRIRVRKAVPNRQSALGLRIAGPTVVVALALAVAIAIASPKPSRSPSPRRHPRFEVAITIPVGDRLRPVI